MRTTTRWYCVHGRHVVGVKDTKVKATFSRWQRQWHIRKFAIEDQRQSVGQQQQDRQLAESQADGGANGQGFVVRYGRLNEQNTTNRGDSRGYCRRAGGGRERDLSRSYQHLRMLLFAINADCIIRQRTSLATVCSNPITRMEIICILRADKKYSLSGMRPLADLGKLS